MVNNLKYTDPSRRIPDRQYKDLLLQVISEGEFHSNAMDKTHDARTLLTSHKLIFDLANGAPIITERDLVTKGKNGRSIFSQSLAEIIAFINGAHTIEQLESFGCYWWKGFITEEKTRKRGLAPGDLGPGSYGAAWTRFPTNDGSEFNQIDALVAQIKHRPNLRTHEITPWIPQYVFRAEGYNQKVVVVPCHGWVHISINVHTGGLTLIHRQRSTDVPVGLPTNLIEYTAFALMIADITGYRAERIVYEIDDAHYYQVQEDAISILLQQEDRIFPTLQLIAHRERMQDFRPDDFVVTDYEAGPRIIIPTPKGEPSEQTSGG